MFYLLLGILLYMFILHLAGLGRETFTTVGKVKKYSKHFVIIVILVWLLFYTEWYVPDDNILKTNYNLY